MFILGELVFMEANNYRLKASEIHTVEVHRMQAKDECMPWAEYEDPTLPLRLT